LLFEERPTFNDLVSGTPNLACIYELNVQSSLSKSDLVNHKDFNWNQYILELKQLYSIIPDRREYLQAYNYQ